MSPFPVSYNGKEWRTTEALFQALRFDNEEIIEEIRNQASPIGAKRKAKKIVYRPLMRIEPTSPEDINNMRKLIRLKANTHPQIKKWLLETGDDLIYEDIGIRNSERDLFWGARFSETGAYIEGTNTMGQLWMDYRYELSELSDEEVNSIKSMRAPSYEEYFALIKGRKADKKENKQTIQTQKPIDPRLKKLNTLSLFDESEMPKCDFKQNMIVTHPKFGNGSILEISITNGNTILSINFENAGLKKILASMVTPIEI